MPNLTISRPRHGAPRIGVAFGGGSARGLGHFGVVRWFEEHRIPIDLIAGTSMGGLIGGAVASGMSAAELTALLATTDWDEMFGFSPFRYKNIRRKDDARDYPSRIEFGVKRGIKLPMALNSGQHVEFLLAASPARTPALELRPAAHAVPRHRRRPRHRAAGHPRPGIAGDGDARHDVAAGHLSPVERDGRVLVDGGAMNNVPADVVRAMGADIVIAINVGFMGDTRTVNRSMLGLMGQTVDVMMQANRARR